MRAHLFFGILALAVGCTEPEATIQADVEGPRRLAVGTETACAIDKTAQTVCWGLNSGFSEYGISQFTRPTSPVPVAAAALSISSISGVTYHWCGLSAAGAAICWGRGGSGQLGRGEIEPSGNTPAAVAFSGPFAGIRAGRLTTCAWTSAGAGFCWGLNQRGEIGDSAISRNTKVLQPARISGAIQFASIVPGWQHTCGLAKTGEAYCWGLNRDGQLGIGAADTIDHLRPVPISSSLRFRRLAVGARSSCGITTSGQVYCWGANGTGQLGDGTTAQRDAPTAAVTSERFVDIAMSNGTGPSDASIILPTGLGQLGTTHVCALSEQKKVYCWGWNGSGQLGNGSTTTALTPTPIVGAGDYTVLAVGANSSCAATTTELRCWGSNFWGQLGNGTIKDSAIPTAVTIVW
jgi:alpha-tubulin suppressor-like RCC1 family protein